MDDRDMIREIQRGRKEYLNVIAEKYYDDIYRFCCYQTGSRQDAYDLAQETFLRFIRMVGRYRYQNLKGYLLTIARNVCVDYFRDNKKRREWEIKEAEMGYGGMAYEGIGHGGVGYGAGRDGREMRGWEKGNGRSRQEEFLVTVEQLAAYLPQAQREAVVLYYGYGFKYREIAKMTGTGVSTVKSRVRQGTEKLKKVARREDFF